MLTVIGYLIRKLLTAIDKSHSKYICRQLKMLGKNTLIGKDLELRGAKYIKIGNNTDIGDRVSITAWDSYVSNGSQTLFKPQIIIGDNCSIGRDNHITAISSIIIGNGCLTGRWVTITDNSHGTFSESELKIIPKQRKLHSKGNVVIGENVWIGEKATILPGVSIGTGAIIAANAVITKDIPPYSIAAGCPAKVIRKL